MRRQLLRQVLAAETTVPGHEEESTVESISETTKNEANISIAETKSGN